MDKVEQNQNKFVTEKNNLLSDFQTYSIEVSFLISVKANSLCYFKTGKKLFLTFIKQDEEFSGFQTRRRCLFATTFRCLTPPSSSGEVISPKQDKNVVTIIVSPFRILRILHPRVTSRKPTIQID